MSEAITHATSQIHSRIDWSALTNPTSTQTDWSRFTDYLLPSQTDWSGLTDYLLPPVDLDAWKSVAFNVRSPEIERAIYHAARPGIVEVIQELREMYDFSKLNVMTTWIDSPFIADSITIDLPDVFDLPDEPFVTIPLRAPRRRRRRRKLPEFAAPLNSIDTTTTGDKQPLISVKRIVNEISGTRFTVLILGGYASAGAVTVGVGGYLGGALGSAMMGTVTLVLKMRDKL